MDRYDRPGVEVVAYTAGLFDGEGWCGWGGKGANYRMCITQSTVNDGEQLCLWLRDQWNLGVVSSQRRVTNLGIDSTVWNWHVRARWDLHFVLGTLMPYLHVKRRVAADVIGFVEATSAKYRAWSPKEDEYLRANLGGLGPTAIGRQLGRTARSVGDRTQRLGMGRFSDHRRGAPGARDANAGLA